MSARTLVLALALALVALVAAAVWLARPPAREDTRLSLAEAMRSDTAGFARAVDVRPFEFPRDHGPHPAFRTEWWYVTGNLDVDAGNGRTERVGIELTLFRIALAPDSSRAALGVDTAWTTRQMFMAHFGLTDVGGRRFTADERFSRAGAGLAGAQSAPFRVWVDDWEIAEGPGGVAGDLPTFRLRASSGSGEDRVAVDLTLRAERPAVLQGNAGLSQKGPEPGNASYYYSIPRLAATGTVTRRGPAASASSRRAAASSGKASPSATAAWPCGTT